MDSYRFTEPLVLVLEELDGLKIANLHLKVNKSQKQNNKFSHTPKNQRNFVHFFALASKKWLKPKIIALDDLN